MSEILAQGHTLIKWIEKLGSHPGALDPESPRSIFVLINRSQVGL